MNYFIIFAGVLVIAVLAGLAIRFWGRRRLTADQLLRQLIAVDLECFHALLRSMDAHCLRELSGRDARAVRRRFTLAAMGYVDRVRRNAAIYAQLATRATHSPDKSLAADARALAPMAFQVRWNASLAFAMMALRLPFPATRALPLPWLGDYEAVGPRLAQLSAALVPVSGT